MDRRDYKITLDHAHGKTFVTIAREYNINTSRAHQIFRATMARLGLPYDAPPHIIGLEIQSRLRPYAEQGTPEWMWRVFENERAEDNRVWYYSAEL